MKETIKTLTIFPDAFICLNCGAVFVAVEDIIDHCEETGHMIDEMVDKPFDSVKRSSS
jgi:hypothetical protein